jgi:transposase
MLLFAQDSAVSCQAKPQIIHLQYPGTEKAVKFHRFILEQPVIVAIFRQIKGQKNLAVNVLRKGMQGHCPVSKRLCFMNRRHTTVEEKLKALALAEIIGNISEACRITGMARSSFYMMKAEFEKHGLKALEPRPRRKPRMPNQASDELVQRVLELTREFPSYSYNRMASLLVSQGMQISGGGVRKIWERHGLQTRLKRFLWVENEASAGRGTMSERSKKLLWELRQRTRYQDNKSPEIQESYNPTT